MNRLNFSAIYFCHFCHFWFRCLRKCRRHLCFDFVVLLFWRQRNRHFDEWHSVSNYVVSHFLRRANFVDSDVMVELEESLENCELNELQQKNYPWSAKKKNRQMKASFNAVENSPKRCSDVFLLFLVGLFQKRPRASFSKIKTKYQVMIFLSTVSQLTVALWAVERIG